MMRIMRAITLPLLCLVAMSAQAASYSVPSDRDLVHRASAIVEGRVLATSYSESGPLKTVVTLRVDDVLKGESGAAELTFVMPGGARGDRWAMIGGAPQFQTGDEVLLFLGKTPSGEWTTYGLGLGAFFRSGSGTSQRFTREKRGAEINGWSAGGEKHIERDRAAIGFRQFIHDTVKNVDNYTNYFIDPISASSLKIASNGAGAYLLSFCAGSSDCKPARWPTPSFGFKSIRSQGGASDSGTYAQTGISGWNNDSNSDVAMSFNGPDPAQTFGIPYTNDGKNSVVFDTTSAELVNVGSAAESIGFTAIYGDGAEHTHPFTGEQMRNIVEADVFIKSGVTNSGAFFEQVMAHEIGHALGFAHTSSGAIMNGSVNGAYGANLQEYDRNAVQTVYGPGPVCTAPSITDQPDSASVEFGQGTSFSVTANGSATLAFQWFIGASGNTSSPISGATSPSYFTTQAGDYWVRVSNSCGAANSQTATLTVGPCAPAEITQQPESATVQSGQGTTLSVGATGSALNYQWHIKTESGNTPINGATGPTFSTGPLSVTTTYVVRVSNACGNVLSADAIVTVAGACQAPAITAQSPSTSVAMNGSTTLSVTANGTSLMYQWYRGSTGNTSSPISGATGPSYNTGSLTATATYWVRVKNSCGQADSVTITVTVGQACVAASIVAQPASTSVPIGATATLTVTAAGTSPLSYRWYGGSTGNTSTPITGATNVSYTTPAITQNSQYWVRVTNSCGQADSNTVTITAVCVTTAAPSPRVAGEVVSGQSYAVTWAEVAGANRYEIQESTSPEFIGATTTSVTSTEARFQHGVTTATRYYYRVRAFAACNGTASSFSKTAEIAIVATPTANDLDPNATAPEGSTQPITFTYRLMPGGGSGKIRAHDDPTFAATTGNSTFLTVTPASGTIPPNGITLIVTADPKNLPTGTNTGSLVITTGGNTVTTPISISIVTAVTPEPKTSAPASAMLIPVVGHADGANGSKFLSDLRITNTASQKQTYEMTYTPSGQNGAVSGKKTTVEIPANDTKAFNDVVKNWFGLGSTGDSAVGVLEIRPLAGGAPGDKATVASSRTYNLTANGTFGQFIPAISISDFVGKATSGAATRISLQQVAESANYRTNFGIVEGSGEPASVLISVFNANGGKIRDITLDLAPFEHRQYRLLQQNGIALEDGRIEVQVTSASGKVTAYASVVDNRTNDPLLVSPVVVGELSTNRYVLPGIADINSATNSWRSDVRLFNSSNASVNATLTFYPQLGVPGSVVVRNVSIPAQSVVALDNVLASRFGISNTGGSVHVTTSTNTPLIISARTYDDQREAGTYGQFIPAVTAADAVGLGDPRPLQVLQLEESDRFRTNLGLAEVTGQDALVELVAYTPDSKIAVIKQFNVPANALLQVGRILDSQMGLKPAYNARISIRVVGGQGKIAAYASVIDNRTQDPTYVPAQ